MPWSWSLLTVPSSPCTVLLHCAAQGRGAPCSQSSDQLRAGAPLEDLRSVLSFPVLVFCFFKVCHCSVFLGTCALRPAATHSLCWPRAAAPTLCPSGVSAPLSRRWWAEAGGAVRGPQHLSCCWLAEVPTACLALYACVDAAQGEPAL